jgi:hypothetical protein
MPDATPPALGWRNLWRATGRTRTVVGWFGWTWNEREEWRYPDGDENVAPEFRWVRGALRATGPTPNAIREEVAFRAARWPT